MQSFFTRKRLKYSLLDEELKAQTGTAKKQYQKLDDTNNFDKIIKQEKATLKIYNRWNPIYSR